MKYYGSGEAEWYVVKNTVIILVVPYNAGNLTN